MNRVLVLAMMRQGSERLPEKLLAQVGGMPLAMWSLSRMRDAAMAEGVDFRLGVWPGDRVLLRFAGELSTAIVARTETSARGETVEDIYDMGLVSRLEEWDWCVVAGCCSPFIPVESFRAGIQYAKTAVAPKVSAFRYRGWVWDSEENRIIGENALNTKTSPVYYVPAHVFNVVKVADMGTERMLADCGPLEIARTAGSMIHVDTPEDLRLAQAYAGSATNYAF